MPVADKPFRILSLDGGGAKGVYTLGVLKEIEALIGCPLWEHFDLVFGTSTGSIIAALTCLGNGVDESRMWAMRRQASTSRLATSLWWMLGAPSGIRS